jgi:hypothetical protein
MRNESRASMIARGGVLLATVVLSLAAAGCNPYTTAVKLGVKVVGQTVNDVDVKEHARLVGQPVSAADAAFGRRLRTLEETRTGRQMIAYPVKDDVLAMFRWVVETQNGSIVALAKVQNDPDGSQDIAEKVLVKAIVEGKTSKEVQSHDWFHKLILVLRDCSSGNLVRVYDVSGITDLMGARYCVLQFNGSDRCEKIWLVGVPAKTAGSSIRR